MAADWSIGLSQPCHCAVSYSFSRSQDLSGFSSNGFVSTEMSSSDAGNAVQAAWPLRRHAVARLKGVSAELRQSGLQSTDVLSASDAKLALASAPNANLKAGFETEFVTKEHRRVAIWISGERPLWTGLCPTMHA